MHVVNVLCLCVADRTRPGLHRVPRGAVLAAPAPAVGCPLLPHASGCRGGHTGNSGEES